MAIHDVDRSPRRESPMPNTHDISYVSGAPIIDQPRNANGTLSINPVTDASGTGGHIVTKNQQVMASDGTNNRALIGYNSGLNAWGLFVSKPGFNADTESNAANYYLNSSQDAFKIVSTGTYTTTAGFSTVSTPTGGHVTESFNHGLGTIPVVMAFIVYSGTYYALPFLSFSESSTYQGLSITVSSDASKIYFTLASYNQGTNWGGVPIKYYILQETAN